jgi:hypothetical protein
MTPITLLIPTLIASLIPRKALFTGVVSVVIAAAVTFLAYWFYKPATIILIIAAVATTILVSISIPVISSLSRRRLLKVRIGEVEIQTKGAAQLFAEVSSRLEFGTADEDRRLMEYKKSKRDEAEKELRPYLPANPRSAKRLINHERLYFQIAEDRDIFGGNPELTYRHLAKWVLIIEHWPRLGAALTRDPDKIQGLESCTDIKALQERLDPIDSNSQATDELLRVLSKTIALSPILGRLVRFEPANVSLQQTRP